MNGGLGSPAGGLGTLAVGKGAQDELRCRRVAAHTNERSGALTKATLQPRRRGSDGGGRRGREVGHTDAKKDEANRGDKNKTSSTK